MSTRRRRTRTLVVGVGSADRGDDAAGLLVARRVRDAAPAGVEVVEWEGDLTALVDAFEGVDEVVIVDALRSGGRPGTVRRFGDGGDPVPVGVPTGGTHDLGVGSALGLAEALGRRPARLVVYGVEGADFRHGAIPGVAVLRGVERAAALVVEEVG